MRILLPVHHFPPTFSAGAELYTLRLGKALRALGHDVDVVAIESIDSGEPDTLRVQMKPFEGLPVWRVYMNLLAASERLTWNFDNPLLEAWFDEYLVQNRPDVIHFQAGYLLGVAPLRAAHKAGIATVLTLHDYWLLCPRHTLLRGDGSLCEEIPQSPAACAWCIAQESRRVQIADRVTSGAYGALQRQWGLQSQKGAQVRRRATIDEAVAYPQVLIAPSHYLASRMQALGVGDRLRILPYGIEQDNIKQGNIKQGNIKQGNIKQGNIKQGNIKQGNIEQDGTGHHQIQENLAGDEPGIDKRLTLRVGYLGQVAHHKGVHLLIEAWQGLRGSGLRELHIYGGIADHAYEHQLRSLARDDSSIHFHGRFTAGERETILQGLDVCVVPSIWFENRPFAIAEALVAGVPVITSRLGGMAEMVRDGVDGLHFAPADVGDLARALQRLLDEPALLGHLQTGARAAKQLSVEEEVALLLEIYEEVAATKRISVQSVSM